jgi:hypothetical protein
VAGESAGENERTYRQELPYGRPLLFDIDPEQRQLFHDLVLQLVGMHYMKLLIFGDDPIEDVMHVMTRDVNSILSNAGSNFAWP